MNIIFNQDLPGDPGKYHLLELDTFVFPDGVRHTAWCVVENIPIMELAQVPANMELHHNLMRNYASQNWDYCQQAIEKLQGKWGGELDTFYGELGTRIQQLQTQDLPTDWSPAIPKG
jgi:hypothetical protein